MNFNVLDLSGPGRLFVVGDVHGHFRLLEQELAKVNFDESQDWLVSVGDLVDRGPDSKDAVDWLLKHWFYAVRGNHEEMCLPLTAGTYWHARNGGEWFNTMVEMDGLEKARRFAHMLTSLPLALEVHRNGKKFGFVHASFPAVKRDSDMFLTDWDDVQDLVSRLEWPMDNNPLLWDRDQVYRAQALAKMMQDCPDRVSPRKLREFQVANVDHVFFGHTPMKEPLHVGNCSWLDTGAFATGNLTVMEVV